MTTHQRRVPTWTKRMPGQYGSNGINSDGSLMNVGNTLSDRPSIKLFPQYNSGDTMRALLADCGGLGDGLPNRPQAIDQNIKNTGNVASKTTSISIATNNKSASTNSTENSFSPLVLQRSLWDAARKGNTQLVRQAISQGANPLKPNPTDGFVALHYAALGNKRLTCQYLLSLPSAAKQQQMVSLTGQKPSQLCTVAFIKKMLSNDQ